MKNLKARGWSTMVVTTGVVLALAAPTQAAPASAASSHSKASKSQTSSDTREVPAGKQYALDKSVKRRPAAVRTAAAPAGVTPAVGTVRQWVALDDFHGSLYKKDYTLRGVGSKIEVWVANDITFPAGDCRSATPGTTTVTDTQVNDLITQFDTNMFPKESAAFSVAPDRDGTHAAISGDYTGNGDKIVTLVDNVRDDNYFDFPANPTYIAGFFSSQFNELLDRNVMTIDAFDWLHRTGANPADQPTDDLCTSRPGRARLYEGVFAHEYQHLLQYYTDPAEVNFINEGLSDFAISLVGYGKPAAHIDQKGQENHISCFQGFGTHKTAYNTNPRDCGGPQNSLTLWGDEGAGNEILADYGNAWSFQLYLYDHYGQAFISALHRDGEEQGLAGVQKQLDTFKPGTKVADVLHDFQTMNLVDRYLDTSAARTAGITVKNVTTKSLDATINLNNTAVEAKPGAAPNGADYVTLYNGPRAGRALQSLSFSGAKTLAPQPLLWTSTSATPAPLDTAPVLWSGDRSNLDAAAVTSVAVPAGTPTLTYNEQHLAEEGYDYAYTVVSTDGGATYTPLANANTVAGPLGPALNGDSAGFATQTFDLTPYAGKTVLIGFRYVSDGGTNDGGWYVDDVKVDGTLISDGSSTAGFKSPTQVKPTVVKNWFVRLVGLDAHNHQARFARYNGKYDFKLTSTDLRGFTTYPLVIAIVSYDDPTEQVQQYAPYTLKLNNARLAGGS